MNELEKEVFEKNLKETQRCIDHLIKITKWLVVLGVVGILSVTAVHGMTLMYLYQYDFNVTSTTTSETVEQSTDGGGDANYIGMDGKISYGETESDKDNKDNNNKKN
jgi:hypothetical protein